MTVHSIADLYGIWLNAGGNRPPPAIYAVAISLAESGGNDQAISPSKDYGLWQINASHASEFPNLWSTRYNPDHNARMAIAISGNGQEWGAWCTAWENPANCGYRLGSVPQPKSPAGQLVAHVSAVLGATPPTVVYVGNDTDTPADAPWSRIQDILGPTGHGWRSQLGNSLTYLKGYGA